MVIWGDVAYVNGMLFSPDFWRAYFKPIVAEQIRVCHQAGLPVIYHGCGKCDEDLARISSRWAWIPTTRWSEVGLDVRGAAAGNTATRMVSAGTWTVLKMGQRTGGRAAPVCTEKADAAKGGGYVFQSDHSVPKQRLGEGTSPVVELVRQRAGIPCGSVIRRACRGRCPSVNSRERVMTASPTANRTRAVLVRILARVLGGPKAALGLDARPAPKAWR